MEKIGKDSGIWKTKIEGVYFVKKVIEEVLRKFGIPEFSTKPTNFYYLAAKILANKN